MRSSEPGRETYTEAERSEEAESMFDELNELDDAEIAAGLKRYGATATGKLLPSYVLCWIEWSTQHYLVRQEYATRNSASVRVLRFQSLLMVLQEK